MPEKCDIELSAVDELLDEAGLSQGSHERPDGCCQLTLVMDDACPPNAHRAILTDRLDDERKGKIARFVGVSQDSTVGRWDARRLKSLLYPIFSETKAQHLGRGPRERQAQQLQKQRDRALEPRVSREGFA